MQDAVEKLRQHYDDLALTGDDQATAKDYNLRDLEIQVGLEYIRDRDALLDVGSGPGVALRRYATQRQLSRAVGLDYSGKMVEMARHKARSAGLRIDFEQGSATEMPFEEAEFDVVTSHRVLLALLEWDTQKQAIREMHRVVRPGGLVLLFEGTADGLERLNFYRRMFRLGEIDEGGRDGYERRLFVEEELIQFVEPLFDIVRVQRFGMYYFLTRILQPLLVAPEQPRYDHPLNDVAREVARLIPDFEHMGQLVGFVLRKRS
jgi:ubiquinone/menaquinone biosynthesis C-methylase UbiE